MTTARTSINGSNVITPSTNLKAWYKFQENTGNTLADSSGNGLTLSDPAAVSAGFWAAASRGNYNATTDRHFLSGDSSSLEIGSLNQSQAFMLSFRMNLSAAAPATAVALLGKRLSGAAGCWMDIFTTGVLRYRVSSPAGAISTLTGLTDVSDAADHHIVIINDPDINDKIYIYVDGAEDTGGGVSISGTPALQVDSSSAAEFTLGAWGDSYASPNAGIGADATATCDLFDVQVYIPTGSLPTNYLALVEWLRIHQYQCIPSVLW